MFRHRLLGLLALGRKATGQPFSKRELEFVQALATLSAAALHNALLIEELQQANRTWTCACSNSTRCSSWRRSSMPRSTETGWRICSRWR